MRTAFSIFDFGFSIWTTAAPPARARPVNQKSKIKNQKWVLLLLAALAGCDAGTRDDRQGLVLKGGAAPPSTSALPMYRVEVARILSRVRPDAEVEDVWAMLQAAAVPHEKQALWEANDLRLGEAGPEAAERLKGLLTTTADRQVHVHTIAVRENFEFRVTFGGRRQTLDLLWTDAEGHLLGRHFEQATAEVRMVCRRDPARPDVVRVAMVPEVAYGEERVRWTETPEGYSRRLGQSVLAVPDLVAEAVLPAGRLLLLGGRRSGPLSLGGAYFHERRGPDLWVHTAVFAVQPMSAPGKPAAKP